MRLLPAAVSLALFLPAAAYATAVGEQVDRGDGPNGTTAWAPGWWSDTATTPRPEAFAITDDGRYALLTYPTSATTRGLYRRDIVLNTSRLILDDVRPTGATTDRSTLSVLTARRLSAADANDTDDLYLVDPWTGAATLASVGPTGKALGGITAGAITMSGQAVVYSSPATGTVRRELATGATTTLAAQQFVDQPVANQSQQAMTPDGRTVVLAGAKVVGPRGAVDVAETNPDLKAGPLALSADGSTAAASLLAKEYFGTQDPDVGAIRVYSLADGSRRTVRAQMPEGWSVPEVLGLTANGTRAIIGAVTGAGGVYTYALGTVDLATGAVAATSDDMPAAYPEVRSPNGRYGLAFDRGHLFAVPAAAGAQLPNGVDGASPMVYLGYDQGCSKPQFYTPDGGRPHVVLARGSNRDRGWALPIGNLVVRAYNASNGALMNTVFLSPQLTQGWINGYYGTVRLDVTATYANGRTAFDRGTVPAYQPSPCYVFQF